MESGNGLGGSSSTFPWPYSFNVYWPPVGYLYSSMWSFQTRGADRIVERYETLWESIAFNPAGCGEIRVGKGDACEELPDEGAQDILE